MKNFLFISIVSIFLIAPVNSYALDCSAHKKWSKQWRVCVYCKTGAQAKVCDLVKDGKISEASEGEFEKLYKKVKKSGSFKDLFKNRKFDETANTQ